MPHTDGFELPPAVRLGHLTYTVGGERLDQINISARDWAATHANQSWDFTQTHTYSELDLTRYEAELWGKVHLASKYWARASHRCADVNDDQPYITDYSGGTRWYGLSLGRWF